MLIGHFLTKIFPVSVTEKLGGLILIGIGAWVIWQFFKPAKEPDYLLHEKTLLNLEVKPLGIVIHILKKPTSADIDQSGTINGVEALLLGIALSRTPGKNVILSIQFHLESKCPAFMPSETNSELISPTVTLIITGEKPRMAAPSPAPNASMDKAIPSRSASTPLMVPD